MKKFLFLMVTLLMAAVMQAQQYKRSDFSFKTTKVKTADGEMAVKVGVYVGSKLIQEFTTELHGEPMETTAADVGKISESDLNFDGYPDVRIYLGYYGAHPNDSYAEALIWDQKQHRFLQAEGYSELPDPVEDEAKHLLSTNLRSGPDHRVTDYYRWNGHKIEHLRSETWAIEDDNPTDFSGLLDLPCYRFDAKLDGRIPVNIVFQKQMVKTSHPDENIVAGYIYYPKAKHPAPILIVGSVVHYGDKDFYNLNEYQPDGIISGRITLQVKEYDYFCEGAEGKWTNPKTQKSMKLTDLSFSREMPKWFTKSALTPEDPGNIGREYSFQEWNENYQDMMGGHVTFRAAGKNKVHFEVCNVRHNIAEGRSEEGRPAVLNGNTFEYHEVNECHYGFRADFFPRFVVINMVTGNETLDCFGMGAAFDGVYIKVKQ